MTFKNCLFTVFNDRAFGISRDSSLYLFHCTFQNTRLGDADGCVFNIWDQKNFNITFQFVCIYNCSCNKRGGAFIYSHLKTDSKSVISLDYLTVSECSCNNRLIYIVEGTNNRNIYNVKHCNFTQSSVWSEVELGMYLFCNVQTKFEYCSFEHNNAQNCLLSIEQTEGYSISDGVIDTCNFFQNYIQKNQLIVFTRQEYYTLKNTMIKGNRMNDLSIITIFGLVDSNIILENCKIQITSITEGISKSDSEITNMVSVTTHPLVFYQTVHCLAEIPFISPDFTPISSPISTPFSTPYITPLTTPHVSPEVTPVLTPCSTPLTTPHISPEITLNLTPFYTPIVSPYNSPEITPILTPLSTPLSSPYNSPETTTNFSQLFTPHTTPNYTETISSSDMSIFSELDSESDSSLYNNSNSDTYFSSNGDSSIYNNNSCSDVSFSNHNSEGESDTFADDQSEEEKGTSVNNSDGAQAGDIEDASSSNTTLYIIIAFICVILIVIAALIILIIIRKRIHHEQLSASISTESDGLSEILTSTAIQDNVTVDLFTSNINEESDPFNNDFEEIYFG